MVGETINLELFGGVHVVSELEVPNDATVTGFASEQDAIVYSMDRARRTTGATQAALANLAGMNKSQWSLLYDGQRGIPVHRFLQWTRAVGNVALLKFYATQLGCKLVTKREWGKAVQDAQALKERVEALEVENQKLRERLAPYEHVG